MHADAPTRDPYRLGPMPTSRLMTTVDEAVVRAPMDVMFDLARRVEEWPMHLSHYRYVRYRERARDGGGLVDMSAYRPFGPVGWPTFWRSEMSVHRTGELAADGPRIRFHHVAGITTGMDVEWGFRPAPGGTAVWIVHVWDGPRWPLIGAFAAVNVIGPVFVHGIASRTLAGLARAAERTAAGAATGRA